MVEGVAKEAEVEEAVVLVVEDSAPLVVEDTVLCPAEFVELERPDWEDGLEEGEEPEVDPDVDPDEKAVFVTLLEPLGVVEKLPVDAMPAIGSDRQWTSFGWLRYSPEIDKEEEVAPESELFAKS